MNAELYVVYDKFTEGHATNLINKLSGKYRMAMWTEQNYNDNQNRLSNNNRFLFLAESLAKKMSEGASKKEIAEGVKMLSNGNMHGIVVDPSIDDNKVFLDSSGKEIEFPEFDRPWLRRALLLAADPAGWLVSNLCFNYGYKQATKSYLLYNKAVDFLCKDDNIKLIIPE